jgi:hypothetical protein
VTKIVPQSQSNTRFRRRVSNLKIKEVGIYHSLRHELTWIRSTNSQEDTSFLSPKSKQRHDLGTAGNSWLRGMNVIAPSHQAQETAAGLLEGFFDLLCNWKGEVWSGGYWADSVRPRVGGVDLEELHRSP